MMSDDKMTEDKETQIKELNVELENIKERLREILNPNDYNPILNGITKSLQDAQQGLEFLVKVLENQKNTPKPEYTFRWRWLEECL